MTNGALGGLETEASKVTDKGIQLADTLMPTAIDVLSGNPHTLAEWLIYIICLPITLPLTFIIAAMRWLMVEAPMVEREILKLVGLDRVANIGKLLSSCNIGGLDFFEPIINALTNPSNEFDLGIMESAASSVTSEGLNIILDPILRPAGYCMNQLYPNKLISPDQAAQLSHRGVIGDDVLGNIMISNGYPGDQSTYLWNLYKQVPDVGSAIQLMNRGYISQDNAITWLRLSGLDGEEASQLINLSHFVPGVGDIMGLIGGDAYSSDLIESFGLIDEYPSNADTDLAKNGADQTIGQMAWVTHWATPGNDILLDMYHRGIIGYDTLMGGLRLNGVPPALRNQVIAQGVTLPMRRMINQMMRYGVIDQTYVFDIFLKFGYSEDDANRLTQLAIKQVNPIEQGDLASDATDAYIDDTIDEPTLITLLKSAGHNDYLASLHAANATHKKNVGILKTIEAYLHDAYINGDMDLSSAVNYMLQYGETPERSKDLTLLWGEEFKHTIKHVSEADARSAYQKGLVNGAQLRSMLGALHYTSSDIDIIIALINTTLPENQEANVAPITTSTGKAKSFTKAELKDMYLDGIIDGNTWWSEMASLGYTDAQISDYAQLISLSAATASGTTTSAS
jgi:hypothetical protein